MTEQSDEKQRGLPLSQPSQVETSTGPVDSQLNGRTGMPETGVVTPPQPRGTRRMDQGPIEIDPKPHEGGI